MIELQKQYLALSQIDRLTSSALSTLILTDNGVDAQTLTSNLGALIFQLPDSINASLIIKPSQTGSGAGNVMSVQIRPTIGNTTGIISNFFGGNVSSSIRAWDAYYTGFTGSHTAGATIIGYDQSSFTLGSPGAGGTSINAYGARLRSPIIGSAIGSWNEIAGLKILAGVKSLVNPTIQLSAGAIIQPPRTAGVEQYGVYIVEGTGTAGTVTTRYGLRIGTQNLGTTIWGLYIDTNKTYLGGDITLADGVDITANATTGTKIGTATTEKLGFFNATPIVQPANTVAINDVLLNLGFRASGGDANFSLNIVPDTNGGRSLGADGLGFSSLWLKDTAAAFELKVQATATGITADRVLTIEMGNANRTLNLIPSAAYTPTNVTTDRSYDANITTIDELADVLGTLIADLQAKNILG